MDVNKNELLKIANEINELKNSSKSVFIKDAVRLLSKSEWISFLQENCSLIIDRRHISDDLNIALADWWEVSYQPSKATSYAHSNTRQPLHTDNSWFQDPAEINFFIMEKQAMEGGEQLLYPIERIMSDLQSENPGLLDDLCSIEVLIKKANGSQQNKTTIIVPDSHDPKIFWNFYRTEKSNLHIDKMCDSFFSYLEKKVGTSSIDVIKSQTGDAFAFNDLKLVHGRNSFKAENPFDRVLIQSMWKVTR